MSGRDDREERKEAPNVDGMFTLKVDNISFRTTVEILKEEFSKYGDIGDVYIPRDFHSKEPRGFAFVRFESQAAGEDAQREMDGREIDGRVIRIQEAKEKRPDNPREAMSMRRGGRDDRRGGYREDRDYRERDSRGGDRDRGGYERGGYSRESRDYRGDRDRGRDWADRDDRDYRGGGRDSDRGGDRGYERRGRSRSGSRGGRY